MPRQFPVSPDRSNLGQRQPAPGTAGHRCPTTELDTRPREIGPPYDRNRRPKRAVRRTDPLTRREHRPERTAATHPLLRGILVAPFLLVAALTGLAYTINPQLDRALYGEQLVVERVGEQVRPLAEQIAAALGSAPGRHPRQHRPRRGRCRHPGRVRHGGAP
ncbi:PepSY domain-containing protein [Micromonospora fulviviridis]|uniref:PepSY domain-containing protein n=1 Tax=Micromonospora fulviviridis TaxID=47860 RepID=UPI003788BD6A